MSQAGEEEEEASSEPRAQALRALLLARKKKDHASDHTGRPGCLGLFVVAQMTTGN